MKKLGIIGRLALAFLLSGLLPASRGLAQPIGQIDDPLAAARALMVSMSPEERIGQLFLVTFDGNLADASTQIYDLIRRYHIGGVVLSAANENFLGGGETVSDAYRLIGSLQQSNWDISLETNTDADTGQTSQIPYIPLLIGVSQNGDGYPEDQILDGLTPLPSLMAIGATWQPEMAERVGRTLGRELEALGVNLVLGPSLDVLDPQYGSSAGGGLGANSFGSDPFWTQELGKAYISGIHTGSQGRLMVVAKHFPGQGGSDRNPETEVATVRKSLEQLKQIELAPFLAVTNYAQNPLAVADGFLVSHIRYQGFQGNIRETTRPVSLDKTAIDELMKLPEFLTWHQNGGVLISDNLGSQSVSRFYETIGQDFDSRLVARDAFLAGNDLLYLDDFISGTDPDSYTSIIKTLDYFTTKYRDDPAFAQRVDDSVLRILTMKLRLYPEFEIGQVIPDENHLGFIQNSDQVTLDVARSAVTLISPSTSELVNVLPAPPDSRDRVLFITDTLTGTQCGACTTRTGLTVDALQSAVLRLYGPGAGGQVNSSRLISYSFEDLINVLDYVASPTIEPFPLENDLAYSQWIVFSILDVASDRPASVALRRLLSERPDLLRNKRVIVFSFNAPTTLDATDISKVTAYYALYSKTPAFLDVAARVLFNEQTPAGAPPVSVPGIGYDIIQVTAPDPNQVIPLAVDYDLLKQPETSTTDTPQVFSTPMGPVSPTFKVNDTIPIVAGPILDHNGHRVPDNTIVRFSFVLDGGATGTMTTDAVTVQGIAKTTYHIDQPGMLEIRVASDAAKTSVSLQLNVSGDAGAPAIAITPTTEATIMPTPTATLTPSPTPTETPVVPASVAPDFTDWVLAMLLIGLSGVLVYMGWMYRRGSIRWGLRTGLCTILGGLAAYSYVAIGMPGGAEWLQNEGTRGVLLVTLLGITLGLGGGYGWRAWLERKAT